MQSAIHTYTYQVIVYQVSRVMLLHTLHMRKNIALLLFSNVSGGSFSVCIASSSFPWKALLLPLKNMLKSSNLLSWIVVIVLLALCRSKEAVLKSPWMQRTVARC